MKKIVLVNRYNTKKVDQEFFDLDFARQEYESEMETQLLKEDLTEAILNV